MIHLTSCLLVCLISAGNYFAARQKEWSHWSSKLSPKAPIGPPNNRVVNPKSFSIEFKVPEDKDNDNDHDQSQSYRPSFFNLGPSHTVSSKYPNRFHQDASKPGVQLALNLPFPKTTTAGVSQNKYIHNPSIPTAQKPVESKLVSIFNKLLIHGGQSNQNSQSNAQKHSSYSQSGLSVSSPQTQKQFWMGHTHFGGSTDAAQTPAHHTVKNTVHHPPPWYHIHKPPPLDDDDILHYLQYVNGQLMIPLKKCPGFEYLAETLKRHYYDHIYHHGPHSHGHTSHGPPLSHSHIHQHGHPFHGPPLSHGHRHQHGHRFHGPIHQHGLQSNSHVHHHGPPSNQQIQTKPNYAHFFLNVQGTAPSPSQSPQETAAPTQSPQETNVQLFGAYQENPYSWWEEKPYHPYMYQPKEQQSAVRPPHVNYGVHVGANVEYDQKPDTQSQSNFPYFPHGRH